MAGDKLSSHWLLKSLICECEGGNFGAFLLGEALRRRASVARTVSSVNSEISIDVRGRINGTAHVERVDGIGVIKVSNNGNACKVLAELIPNLEYPGNVKISHRLGIVQEACSSGRIAVPGSMGINRRKNAVTAGLTRFLNIDSEGKLVGFRRLSSALGGLRETGAAMPVGHVTVNLAIDAEFGLKTLLYWTVLAGVLHRTLDI
ncbi:hypothetical protein TNCV_2661901 [Trichonephila clavipes]|nr:hypothetical protein TNCV_2661901 [Trichonephila clavipes]